MGSSYSTDWFKEDVLPTLIQYKNDYENRRHYFPHLPTSDVTVLLSYINNVIGFLKEKADWLGQDATNEDIHDFQLAINQFLPDEFHIEIDPEHVGEEDEDLLLRKISDLDLQIFRFSKSMLEKLEAVGFIPHIADNPSIDDVDYITSEIASYFHPPRPRQIPPPLPPPPPSSPPRSRRRLPSTPTGVLYERQRFQRNLGPRYS